MKSERVLHGSFDEIVSAIVEGYCKKNRGNQLTDCSDLGDLNHRVAIRTIEKFSNTLLERISTTLVFVEGESEVQLTMISTGFEGILFNRGPEGKARTIDKLNKIIDELGY